MKQGLVVKSTGSWYQVWVEEDQRIWESRTRGKFRLDGKKLTNPVAVGDEVLFSINDEDETGVIKKILPRRNYVVRQSPRKKHDLHLLASNIDQAMVIVTIIEPMLKQGFIDRFLLMTEPYNIPTTIVFNKADLYEAPELGVYEHLQAIYEPLGYTMLLTSALSGIGLEALKRQLKDKITLLSGQSGVGKSSLVNSIQPQLDLKTGDISNHSGKGQHTTTFAEMLPLDFGGKPVEVGSQQWL